MTLLKLMFVFALLALLAVVLAFTWHWIRQRKRTYFANIAEGVHEAGKLSYTADAAIVRWLLVKRGAAATSVAVCGAADVPIGVTLDEANASYLDVPIAVQMLGGCAAETVRMTASAAIAQDALVEPAAGGKIATLGGGAGTHYIVGRAIVAAAADGDIIEVVPMYFQKVI